MKEIFSYRHRSEIMQTFKRARVGFPGWAGVGLLLFVLTGLSFGALLAVLSGG